MDREIPLQPPVASPSGSSQDNWYRIYNQYDAMRQRINYSLSRGVRPTPAAMREYFVIADAAYKAAPTDGDRARITSDWQYAQSGGMGPQKGQQGPQVTPQQGKQKPQAKSQAKDQPKPGPQSKGGPAPSKKGEIPTIINTVQYPEQEQTTQTSGQTSGSSSSSSSSSSTDSVDTSIDTIMKMYENLRKMQESGADQYMVNYVAKELAHRISLRDKGTGMSDSAFYSQFGEKNPIAAMANRETYARNMLKSAQTYFDGTHRDEPTWFKSVKTAPPDEQIRILGNFNPTSGTFASQFMSPADRALVMSGAVDKNTPYYKSVVAKNDPQVAAALAKYSQHSDFKPYPYQGAGGQSYSPQSIPSYQEYGNLSPGQDASDRFGYNAIIHEMAQQVQPPVQQKPTSY